MKIKYSKQFIKDVKKHAQSKKQIFDIITEFKKSDSIQNIINVRKLNSKNNDFRIRIGNFRIGFTLVEDYIIFKRFLHRKDIYKYFP